MPDATGNSLVMAGAFGSFDLLGNPNWRIAAGTKWDLGAAQPDISVIVGDLLSGDRVSGSRSGNRTIVLPLLLTAADRITVAANLNPLLRTVDCQPPNESFTLTWTPAGGLPVTFDCYRGSYQRTRSLSLENAGGTLVTLTFAAAPFGRSNAPVTVAAASPQLQIDSLNTAPTNGTLDTTNKYEGTGSAAVTLTRQSVTVGYGRTSYWYTSPNVSRTISSIDLTPYASIGHRFRWPAPAFLTPWTAILTVTVSDGTYSASASVAGTPPPGGTAWYLMTVPISALSSGAGTGGAPPPPMPNLAAITKWTWSLATVHQTLTSAPPATSTANIDDLRAFPSSSTAISTSTGAVVTIPAVIGTAPAPAALTVTEGGGSMTNLLLHRPPVDQSPDAAILAALSGSPKTATIAAANNTFRGTYSVVLLISSGGTGSRTVSVQFDHKQGSTVLASQTVSTSYSTPTGRFAIMRDYVTLPLVPVPDENTTDTLVITVTSSGGTADTFTDIALIDTRGQLALLGALPLGTKTVYIDEPDPIGELGQIYASATDRTAASGQLGWGAQTRVGSGPIVLEPGDNRLLAASPDGVVPTITLTYDPRWLDERDQ